jgi:hypothetical protein
MFVLTYCNPGPDALARGIAAAERYFQDTGADPAAAWRAAEALAVFRRGMRDPGRLRSFPPRPWHCGAGMARGAGRGGYPALNG